MIVVMASDHAGYELKQVLLDHVRGLGHEVVDVGTHSTDPVDYPDYAVKLAAELLSGRAERGIPGRASPRTRSPAFAPATSRTTTRRIRASSTTT
ncbi:MAG: RpiB/LacA/LacB family sugar-phosphate isomerase [Planctomycetota bacterium]